MKKPIVIIAFFAMLSFLFTSCLSDEEKNAKFTQIAESRTTQQLLQDLLIGSDDDVQAISRILHCTPSSIERIIRGETVATTDFAERVVEVSVYYNKNHQSFVKLRAEFDSEFKWYNKVISFPKLHPGWFWVVNIALFLGLAFAALVFVWPLLLELLFFLLCWLISLVGGPGEMEDRYENSVNPLVEQVYQVGGNSYSSRKTKQHSKKQVVEDVVLTNVANDGEIEYQDMVEE